MNTGQNHVFIIAEAGVNHNGDYNTALKMIDAAKAAGADAIKFQTFRSEKLVSRNAQKANIKSAIPTTMIPSWTCSKSWN